MDDAARQQLREIATLWNKVELRAKLAVQIRFEVVIAAVNEMRYAGRRLVDTLLLIEDGAPAEEINRELNITKNYLINADHDITDAILFFIHKRIARTIDQHGFQATAKHLPDFTTVYPQVRDANEAIRGSRADRQSRSAAYDKLADDYVPLICAFYDKLIKIDALRVADVMDKRLALITGLSLWGAVASILGLLLGIVGITMVFLGLT